MIYEWNAEWHDCKALWKFVHQIRCKTRGVCQIFIVHSKTAATMTSLSTLGHAERSRWSAFNLQQVLCDDVGEQPESCTKSLECCSLDFRNKYADSIILLGRSLCVPQRRSRLASAPSSSERCYLQRRSSNETTSVQHNDLFIRNPQVLLFEEGGPGHSTFLSLTSSAPSTTTCVTDAIGLQSRMTSTPAMSSWMLHQTPACIHAWSSCRTI